MDNLDEILKRFKERAANGSSRHGDADAERRHLPRRAHTAPMGLSRRKTRATSAKGGCGWYPTRRSDTPTLAERAPATASPTPSTPTARTGCAATPISAPLSRMTFDSANPRGRADDPESRRMFSAAYQAALAYADNPTGWLALTGPNGSGKTHLAAAIANRCIERGSPVFFVHVPDLLDDLRSTYSPNSAMSYSELFEQVNEAPLLILDGLGTQSPDAVGAGRSCSRFSIAAPTPNFPQWSPPPPTYGEIDPYISSRMLNRDLCASFWNCAAEATKSEVAAWQRPRRKWSERMTFDKFDTRGNAATTRASGAVSERAQSGC